MTSFDNQKDLRFVITLGIGTFGSAKANQVTLQGYRAIADVDKAGGMMMGTLRAQIYGVSQSDMNSITTLRWKPDQAITNYIEVYAIDGTQETLVFAGWIVNAWGNYQAMPDVYLQIQAQAAYAQQLTPVLPRSFKGSVDVATVMQQIATSMGYNFENNGVSVQISNQYLANTDLEQAKTLALNADIDLYVDDKILAIAPRNTPRATTIVPEISADTGMVSYPTFDGTGVNFQMLFNPSVTFGGRIKITSSIIQASGEWIVTSLAYRLSSQKEGPWFSTVRGNAIGLAISK